MNHFLGHLKTINHHKWLVTRDCIRVGLVKQGLLHDLSKYAPVEFLAGVRYFQGTCSPINQEKKEKGYSSGWLHHKGRNPHHFEYWIDYAVDPKDGLVGIKMPKKYVVEMAIDRICASKNYQKEHYTDRSALEYFEKGKAYSLMHPDSMHLLEYLLRMVAKKGERWTYHYIRTVVLKNRDHDYLVKDGKIRFL